MRKAVTGKERSDILMVRGNPAGSRKEAKALIVSEIIYVNGQEKDKAGTSFEEAVQIGARGNVLKYVNRGGLELEKTTNRFGMELAGKVRMSVGVSTGGFTDCMLQNGAVKVYVVDAGRRQLAWKLRDDDWVIYMEKTNTRYVTLEDIGGRIRLASINASFVSLTKVLEPVKQFLTDNGRMACLIKPQFGAGREKVGKKDVVRERGIHLEVIKMIMNCARSTGLDIWGLESSPIKGPEGDIEYLLYLQNKSQEETGQEENELPARAIVKQAHGCLGWAASGLHRRVNSV